jgi:hypothetical protein
MRVLTIVIAVACSLWAVDRFEFHSRYTNSLWRGAQSKAALVNYEVKRWFRAIS